MGFAKYKRIVNRILFDYQTDAEEILKQLKEIVKNYGKATVKDLLDLVRVTPEPDNDKSGWYSFDGANIYAVDHHGKPVYCLELPNPGSLTD